MVGLIVDDLPELRDLVQINLESDFPAITFVHANNALEAVCLLEQLGPRVSFIVCDFNMPGGNGDIVFKKWQESFYHIPFIMLTSEVVRARAALLRGQKNLWQRLAFIEKDGDFSSLSKTLLRVLDKSFITVPMQWIRGELPNNYSLHIALSDKKIVEYCHAGDSLTSEKIRELKARGVRDFLIPAMEALKRNKVWPQLKLQSLSSNRAPALGEAFENFQYFHQGLLVGLYFSKETFEKSCRLLAFDVERLVKSDCYQCFVEKGFTVKDYIFNHSMLVSMISFMILDELKLTSPTNRKYLIEACLFHDIFLNDEKAYELDLIVDEFDGQAQKNKVLQILSVAKEVGLSSDSEKIIESLCLHRLPRDMSNGRHKLARIARMAHLIVSDLYKSSFISHFNEEKLRQFDDDKNILKALDLIFL